HPATERLTSDGLPRFGTCAWLTGGPGAAVIRRSAVGWASGAGGADGAGRLAPGAAGLTGHRMHARRPGTPVGVGGGLGQPRRAPLRFQLAAEPALAALPCLLTKGGGTRPALARHAELAVDLAVMRPAARDRMGPGDSVWQRIKALSWVQAEHRGAKRMGGGVGRARALGDERNDHRRGGD